MYKRVEEYGLARQMTGSNTGYNSISISAMVNEKKMVSTGLPKVIFKTI